MIATPQERLEHMEHVMNSGTGRYLIAYDVEGETQRGHPVYTDKLTAEADAKRIAEVYDLDNVRVEPVE